MFIYNSLPLCHHNFDIVVLRNQFRVVHKFNQNIMTRSLPLNLKQTYRSSSICPFSFLLSRTCLKHVLQIVIITLFYRNKNILNLIIMLSLDLFSSKINNHFFFIPFLVTLVWNLDLFWSLLCVGSSCCDGPFLLLLQIISLSLLFKMKNENRTNLFTCACFSFRHSKTVFLQSIFVIFVILSNRFKSFLKL